MSKMLHLQVTREIPNLRHEVYCAYSDHTRMFPFRWRARNIPQFLTAVHSLKLFRLTQVHEWTAHRRFNVGNACWKRYPVSQPKETLSITTRKSRSVWFILWQLCIWVNWSDCAQHSQHLTVNPTLHVRRQAVSDPNDQPMTKARHTNVQSRCWSVVWESAFLDHSIFDLACANNRSSGGHFETKRVC